MVSAKTLYYIRVILTPIFIVLNGTSSALNFFDQNDNAGYAFGASAATLLLFWVMVIRLGYKSIPEQINDEMVTSGLVANEYNQYGNNNNYNNNNNNVYVQQNQNGYPPYSPYSPHNVGQPNVINQVSIPPYEVRAFAAEETVLFRKTIFRQNPTLFLWIGACVALAALAGSAWFLKIAIEEKEQFEILVSGNKWVPFIGCIATFFPSLDIIKVAVQTKRAVAAYLNGGVTRTS